VLRAGEEGIPVNTLKEAVGAVIRDRGWEGSEDGTKAMYSAVAKRVIKIARGFPGGGKVTFSV
jgi:hypothetical protein